MDWAKTTARGDEKHLSFEIWCDLYKRFYGNCHPALEAVESTPRSQLKEEDPVAKNGQWASPRQRPLNGSWLLPER